MAEQRGKIIFIVILAILILTGSFYSFWQKSSVSENTSSGEALAKGVKAQEEKTTEIIVYISGAVNKPGVFKVFHNARVIDVVTMAGGLTPEADVSKINMAQLVKDGMHIHVVARSVVLGGGDMLVNAGKGKVSAKVNINTAEKSELDALPGIGPSLAERILEYRQTNGSFNDIDDLKKVTGIGSSKFEKIKDKITL
ncbi:MAG: competence protein ComEA helix-hairpin-helix repeat protein [Firmicutes bacterium]|nr:competence protein ComEA helix-hairpin-helix repeat protein [Bacillota bacterium]